MVEHPLRLSNCLVSIQWSMSSNIQDTSKSSNTLANIPVREIGLPLTGRLSYLRNRCDVGIFPESRDNTYCEKVVTDCGDGLLHFISKLFRMLGSMLSGPAALLVFKQRRFLHTSWDSITGMSSDPGRKAGREFTSSGGISALTDTQYLFIKGHSQLNTLKSLTISLQRELAFISL